MYLSNLFQILDVWVPTPQERALTTIVALFMFAMLVVAAVAIIEAIIGIVKYSKKKKAIQSENQNMQVENQNTQSDNINDGNN